MKREVNAAVDFLLRLARERGGVNEERAGRFAEKLRNILRERYAHHWYPGNPSKGQGYRCIRVNSTSPCDWALERACRESGMMSSELRLPREITLWIDPYEVCARSGEGCRFFTVARFEGEEEKESQERHSEEEGEVYVEGKGKTPPPTSKEATKFNESISDDLSSSPSDCSSDQEEEEEKKEKEKKCRGRREHTGITIIPRVRKPRRTARTQVHAVQCFYTPAPLWPTRSSPVFVSTAQPPVLGYYVLPKHPPHFLLPPATCQPWGLAKG